MFPPLDELQWKSPEWIQSFGLRTDNVLDYFSQSPFFDRTSNNQAVKMQHQFSQHLPLDTTQHQKNLPKNPYRQHIWDSYPLHAFLEHELAKLKGIEFILAYVREPDFWVIRKQNRTSETSTTPLNDYYIIGANVYQSPTAFRIIHNRLLSTNYHLSKTLVGIKQLYHSQPSRGSTIALGQESTISSMTPTGSTVATTSSIGNTTGVTNIGMTAPMETTAKDYQDILTQDIMDKLMLQSIRTTPTYL